MSCRIILKRERRDLGHLFARFYIAEGIRKTLAEEQVRDDCEISVMLTDNSGIRSINREYRDTDNATDVLSFPQNELVPGSFCPDECERNPENGRILLGDMVLSVERCEEQGKEFGHGFKREIMYLTVHSVLHLLGYDHLDEGEMKRAMRAREKKIMGDD